MDPLHSDPLAHTAWPWGRRDSSARSSSCALTCAASAVAVSSDAGQHARSSKHPPIHEVEPMTHQCAPNCSSTS